MSVTEDLKPQIIELLRSEPGLSGRKLARRLGHPESTLRPAIQAARASLAATQGDTMASESVLYEMAMADPAKLQVGSPFNELFPIRPKVLDALGESMMRDGWHASKPIEVWRQTGQVIDGHTRRQAAIDAKLDGVTICLLDFEDETEALEYAIANQRDRRNLTDAEIARCVMVLDKRNPHGGDHKSEDFKTSTEVLKESSAERTAKLVGTSTTKVESVRAVMDHGDEETKAAVLDGKTKINAAAKKVREKRKAEKPQPAPSRDDREPGDDDESGHDVSTNGHAPTNGVALAVDAPAPPPTEPDALPDEEWLATLTIRDRLANHTRATFDRDALAYRRFKETFPNIDHHARKLTKTGTGQKTGQWQGALWKFNRMAHPRDWKLCLYCIGKGLSGTVGECATCVGRGYVIT